MTSTNAGLLKIIAVRFVANLTEGIDASMQTTRISLAELEQISRDVLAANGFSQPHIDALTQTLIAGQLDDCASHGIYRLNGLINTLKVGKVNPTAVPEISDTAPAIVKVDALQAFSPLAFKTGLPLLVEKAKNCGLAAMAINHCVHFSALWIEIEQLTRQGLVALACNPAHDWVAPAGGNAPVLGTNPIAFGWPRPDNLPFVFDFATAAIARGEIELHRRAGTPIPEGWAVDTEGNPTTDPIEALKGAMLTFGGHKGSALATMIELIAGPLIGDLTSAESAQWDDGQGGLPYHGELILVMDPSRFLGASMAEYFAGAEKLFENIENKGARLPSQRRYKARKNNQSNGYVNVSTQVLSDIRKLLP